MKNQNGKKSILTSDFSLRSFMKFIKPIFLFILISCVSWTINAQRREEVFGKTYTKINIGNISTFIYNDGRADPNARNPGYSGFEYPRGSNKYAVYESGFLWGGKFDGEVRLGGATFPSGLNPGKIISPGVWQNPEEARMYRVRRDYRESSLINEQADEGRSYEEIFNEYEKDWNEWPADEGAPYMDNDGDGYYDPDIDTPGYKNSDQTIWYVANSADSAKTKPFYGSPPTDIELQVTTWAYKRAGSLGNTIFRRYLMINKGDIDAEDMYFSAWSDIDIGNAGDDLVGCDSTLGLGFGYQGNYNDSQYGSNAPAVGYTFLQGPLVEGNSSDVGKSFDQSFPEHKNLNLTSFWFSHASSAGTPISDPNLFSYEYGTLKLYLNMQGRSSIPLTRQYWWGEPPFLLSGDPIAQTGWLDIRTTDKIILPSSGSFNLAVGDTQEIIIANVVAGGTPGIGNLEALALLKDYTKELKQFTSNNFKVPKPDMISTITYESITKSINLKWSAESELSEIGSYEFQGYNIYQLPFSTATLDEGIKIKTFDRIDGIRVITEEYFDEDQYLTRVAQAGNDWGIEHELQIEKDYIANTELHLGSEYYYAITNYNYSEVPWAGSPTFESDPTYITVTVGENAGSDIEKINVFPNPYYGANPNEVNKYQRYVTFSHLPEQATIKIFNLAGQLVKTIYKNEPDQFQRWDLMNEFNILVPGGIYIAYIEMPELGETKILKLAIIPEKIIPDWY
ncbi:MAG: hypothetical protein KKA84_05435 [Bacteroidetes bacterium]|nr:hypothetical protein [Bacteroidota bacterium]